jgi:hypothetical protein
MYYLVPILVYISGLCHSRARNTNAISDFVILTVLLYITFLSEINVSQSVPLPTWSNAKHHNLSFFRLHAALLQKPLAKWKARTDIRLIFLLEMGAHHQGWKCPQVRLLGIFAAHGGYSSIIMWYHIARRRGSEGEAGWACYKPLQRRDQLPVANWSIYPSYIKINFFCAYYNT